MSSSTHQIQLKGVDKTGAAFGSVRNRAAATGAQIRSMLGGALAAAGAYLGFRAIKGGIDELGHLSDVAMKTSTSVDELTQAATAMSVLGIQNMGVEQLAKAFDYMAKTTGRSGMAGFYQTIGEIGKVEDVADRAQMAMKVFGRSGMEFMPLLNAAKDGTEALQGLIGVMPGISDAAAQSADDVSDSMTIAGGNLKKIWHNALGVICRNLGEQFPGGVRQATAAAMVHFGGWVKKAWRTLVWFGTNSSIVFSAAVTNWEEILKSFGEYFKDIFSAIGDFFVGMWNTTWEDWGNGKWFGKGPEMLAAGLEKAVEKAGKKLAPLLELGDLIDLDFGDIDEGLRLELAKIEKLGEWYDKSVKTTRARAAEGGGGAMSLKTPAIRNDLITSINEANRIALLGPQLQNETKKQTEIMSKVEAGVREVADAVKKIEIPKAING